jgi:hypothetical protein
MRMVTGTCRAVLNNGTPFETEYLLNPGAGFGFRAFVSEILAQPRDIIALTDVQVEFVEVSFVLRLFQVIY